MKPNVVGQSKLSLHTKCNVKIKKKLSLFVAITYINFDPTFTVCIFSQKYSQINTVFKSNDSFDENQR